MIRVLWLLLLCLVLHRRHACAVVDRANATDDDDVVRLSAGTKLNQQLLECWTKPTGLFVYSDEVCHLAWSVSSLGVDDARAKSERADDAAFFFDNVARRRAVAPCGRRAPSCRLAVWGWGATGFMR